MKFANYRIRHLVVDSRRLRREGAGQAAGRGCAVPAYASVSAPGFSHQNACGLSYCVSHLFRRWTGATADVSPAIWCLCLGLCWTWVGAGAELRTESSRLGWADSIQGREVWTLDRSNRNVACLSHAKCESPASSASSLSSFIRSGDWRQTPCPGSLKPQNATATGTPTGVSSLSGSDR